MALSRVLRTPELLCQIFEDCLPDIIFLRNTPLDAPLVLTQVCRTWREIAISNSRLWTSFQLEYKNHTFEADEEIDGFYAPLSEWLKRSGQRPFSLKATYDADIQEAWRLGKRVPLNAYENLKSLLLRHKDRWEELDIDLPSSAVNIFHQALNSPSFRELKTLTLRDDLYTGFKTFRIGEAPKLEALYVSGEFEAVNFFHLDTTLPPSVRHLSLTTMSLRMGDPHSTGITWLWLLNVFIKSEDFAKFPAFFPVLEVLIISVDGDSPMDGLPVVFQNLKSLSTSNMNKFPMVDITAPKLTHFFIKNIHCDGDTRMLTFPDALSFLQRSKPPLQSIQIDGIEMMHDDFVALLDLVPNLEELEIYDTDISVASLKALVLPMRAESSEGQAIRCPGLWALHVNRVTDPNPPDGLQSSLSGLIRALVKTRRLSHTSTEFKELGYIGLPLHTDEIEHLERDCNDLWETEIYSTLIEKGTWRTLRRPMKYYDFYSLSDLE